MDTNGSLRKTRRPAKCASTSRSEQKEHWIGTQPSDPSPIIYFSGIPRSSALTEERFDEVTKAQYRCLSYAYCGPRSELHSNANAAALDYCMQHGKRVFLDSGAHTFQNIFYGRKRAEGVENRAQGSGVVLSKVRDYCKAYAQFILDSGKKYGRPFDFYVNFDYEYNCPIVYKVLQELYGYGIRPVPVYHGDQSIDWLKRYIDDGHKLIGISTCNRTKAGKARASYYDACFNLAERHGVKFHGFAQTGVDMFRYPWYSVDSSSWLKAASYGMIIYAIGSGSNFRLRTIHVSSVGRGSVNSLNTMPYDVREHVRSMVEKRGFDLEELRSADPKVGLATRGLFNAHSFVSMSQQYSVRPRQRYMELI